MLHYNEVPCIVPKSSFQQSVFSTCPRIQFHHYACNVSLVLRVSCLGLQSQYLGASVLLNNNVTFHSLSTGSTPLSNSYHHVGLPIFKYLITSGYDVFQKWLYPYSWFEWPYFTNHIWCLVGLYECRLEAFYCSELFWTCAFMAFLFALWNWGDWQPWHHMYLMLSSSSPSIRTWHQLNGETFTGNTTCCKIKQSNKVGHFRIDKFNC